VTRLIILAHVSFDLDDAPGKPLSIQQPHQSLAQQLAGDGQGIAGEKVASEASHHQNT
jgi:hypothetical protein